MKLNKYILTLLVIVITTLTYAQSSFINYQGLALDSSGNAMQSTTITIGIAIKFGSPTATASYEETHSITTDNTGVFSLQIGNGTVVSGSYNALMWNTNAFVTTSINGLEVGTTELHAVPFALNSGDSVWQKNGNDISNTNTGNVGIGTTNPNGRLDVRGDIWLGEQNTGTYKIGKYISNVISSNYIEFGAQGSPIDNYIKFHTHLGGVTQQDVMMLTGSGNVGIGTTNPQTKLHIENDSGNDIARIGDGNDWGILELHGSGSSNSQVRQGAASDGLQLFAGDQLEFFVNADATPLQAMEIMANGNVAIGTTTTTNKVEIGGTNVGQYGLSVKDDGFGRGMQIIAPNFVANTTGYSMQMGSTLSDVLTSSYIMAHKDGKSSFNDLVFNPYGGNIGIGTTTPNAKLHIDNSNNETAWSTQVTTGNNSGLLVDGTNIPATNRVFQASNGTGTEMVVLGNGNVGIGTTNPQTKLHVNDGTIRIDRGSHIIGLNPNFAAANTHATIGTASNIPLRLQVNSDDKISILNNGNIGIGTTSPQATMHINGFMKLEPQNSAPTSPTKGMIYYDNNTDTIKVYTGSWETLSFVP